MDTGIPDLYNPVDIGKLYATIIKDKDLYYQNPSYIEESYIAGRLLD